MPSRDSEALETRLRAQDSPCEPRRTREQPVKFFARRRGCGCLRVRPPRPEESILGPYRVYGKEHGNYYNITGYIYIYIYIGVRVGDKGIHDIEVN